MKVVAFARRPPVKKKAVSTEIDKTFQDLTKGVVSAARDVKYCDNMAAEFHPQQAVHASVTHPRLSRDRCDE